MNRSLGVASLACAAVSLCATGYITWIRYHVLLLVLILLLTVGIIIMLSIAVAEGNTDCDRYEVVDSKQDDELHESKLHKSKSRKLPTIPEEKEFNNDTMSDTMGDTLWIEPEDQPEDQPEGVTSIDQSTDSGQMTVEYGTTVDIENDCMVVGEVPPTEDKQLVTTSNVQDRSITIYQEGEINAVSNEERNQAGEVSPSSSLKSIESIRSPQNMVMSQVQGPSTERRPSYSSVESFTVVEDM